MMTNFLRFSVLLVKCSRKHNTEILRPLFGYYAPGFRKLHTIARKPVQTLLYGKNKFISSSLKNNIRFQSEEKGKKDRFRPIDPFQNKNLWKSVIIVLIIGGVATAIMLHFKNEKLRIREKERKRALGKAAIGGKFELIDSDNKVRKSEDFHGQWLMIYFGFTHCPDICPDEMEKLVKVADKIEKDKSLPNLVPIFISVDPERDTPSVVGKYVKEFSDKIIGLTGTVDQIAAVCKAYRVYFSPGPKDKDSDYIVDHSIIMYLVDPQGEFLDYYGRSITADQIVNGFRFNVLKYEELNKKGFFSNLL